METKIKLLQKDFKNKNVPYIYQYKGKLFATTCGDLGIYDIENTDTKIVNINTLEQVTDYDNGFPNIEDNPMLKISRDEVILNRKQVISALTKVKNYVKDCGNLIPDNKDLCNVIIEDNILHFQIGIQDDSFGDWHFKRFSILLERKHINYGKLFDTYSWKKLLKYFKSCKSDVVKMYYASETSGCPLVFDDGVIYKFYTMPYNI